MAIFVIFESREPAETWMKKVDELLGLPAAWDEDSLRANNVPVEKWERLKYRVHTHSEMFLREHPEKDIFCVVATQRALDLKVPHEGKRVTELSEDWSATEIAKE